MDNNNSKASSTYTILSKDNVKNTNNNATTSNDSNEDDFDVLFQNTNEPVSPELLALHNYVFSNNLSAVKSFIQKHKSNPHSLSARDSHGNTPLHLACMLGQKDIAKMLVEAGAIVKIRNRQMWTPLNEAISYGDRDMIKLTLEKFEKELDHIIEDAKPKIVHALKDMIDFYVEIKWDFESWVPLVSRFLPSDLCKLYKKGTKLRIDCTLGDIARSGSSANGASSGATTSPFSWQRGDLTFLFDIEKIGQKSSIRFLDNKRKIFANIEKDINEEHDIEKEVDLYLSREMIFVKLNTKTAHFAPTQVGWFTKKDKVEVVNGYYCKFYDVNNLFIVSKLRNEHLTDDDIKKNEEKQKQFKKALQNKQQQQQQQQQHQQLQNGEQDNFNDIADFLNVEHKPSLPPPLETHVNWNEYIEAPTGDWPSLGRSMRLKESKKEFKAQLAMSQEFPLTLQDLNRLLDALAPLAKFRKLKEFLHARLPPGFPVKIDIPVVPTVTAKVSFQNFKKNIDLSDSLFTVPDDYTEDVELEQAENEIDTNE